MKRIQGYSPDEFQKIIFRSILKIITYFKRCMRKNWKFYLIFNFGLNIFYFDLTKASYKRAWKFLTICTHSIFHVVIFYWGLLLKGCAKSVKIFSGDDFYIRHVKMKLWNGHLNWRPQVTKVSKWNLILEDTIPFKLCYQHWQSCDF